MSVSIRRHLLQFKQPSGTSRGVLLDKPSWFFESVHPNGKLVQGECSVISGLSPDFTIESDYQETLNRAAQQLSHFIDERLDPLVFLKKTTEDWFQYPSILFGMEMFVLRWCNGGKYLFDNDVTRGERPIPINGLVWMGDVSFMSKQIEEKINSGFRTVKMKIGAIHIDDELELLFGLRRRFSASDITLRVDANGAFESHTVRGVLRSLRELEVHSIEQPIAVGNPEEMRSLCHENIIPIALDEELIGIYQYDLRYALLEYIQPPFIILKPSLHGGLNGCREWIAIAEKLNINWWMTSALESSIGLDAIAQFLGEYHNELPQGLGTGGLYTNNLPSNWEVQNGLLVRVNTFSVDPI
jgi:O-succinylbenzoate synthase